MINKPAFVAARCSVALAIVSLATPATAAPEPVTGDPVLYWHEVLQTGLAGSPTVQSRGYAMVSVALHDAVNAALGKPNNAYIPNIAAMGGDTRAAAAVAARNVLAHLNPDPVKVAEFNAARDASLALVLDPVARAAGIATGNAISAAVIGNRTGDGSTPLGAYSPSGLPGRWAPTPPGFGAAAVPQYATVDPWFMSSPSQFRSGPPPAIDSVAYANALIEVRDIGVAASVIRTQDQSDAANFWVTASGTGPWIRAGIDQAQAKGLSTLESAALFARLSTSVADAVIGIWDAKYHYDYWRPVTGIRNADLDGNPLTDAVAGWTPFIGTPAHPSYISGHSGVGGAASIILTSAFGDVGKFCMTYGFERCWNGFEAAALDGANSRLWGGIHWRFDNEAGLALGQAVGRFTLRQSAFGAVPEPSSWALMIAGFGLIGAMTRWSRRGRRVQWA